MINKRIQAAITRFPSPTKATSPEKKGKIELIAASFRTIMEALGLDLEDPSLAETPERVAKMYVNELFKGLDPKAFPKITTVGDEFYGGEEHMILIRDITVHSTCEHHFVPMIGTAHVAYISHGQVIGLSKINRIVDYFSKRPQLQERLTAQIADCLSIILDSEDVAVYIRASHFCVMMRGIQDTASATVTHLLRGKFKTDMTLHREFLESIGSCH